MSSAFDAARGFPIADLSSPDRGLNLRELVEEVFRSLSVPVFHYLVSLSGDATEAEDLTQEVFLRLCSELKAGRRIGHIRPWCFKVAHNLAVSVGRRKQTEEHYRASTGEQDCTTGADASGIEDALLRSEQSRRVSAAMSRLTAMERQCLHLRAEGLLYREIADVLEIRVPTVQTFLARAMKKIVKELHA